MSETNKNPKMSELLENFQNLSTGEQAELIASFKRIESGELTDEQLEGVVGGYDASAKKEERKAENTFWADHLRELEAQERLRMAESMRQWYAKSGMKLGRNGLPK